MLPVRRGSPPCADPVTIPTGYDHDAIGSKNTMGVLWTTILRWVLPTIPELISTVRNMKKQPQVQRQAAQEDLIGRIEQMEKTLELQSHINTTLTVQLQQLQTRLQVLTFVAIFALVLAIIALGIVFLR